MPRKYTGPRLWFDTARQSWTIVDGRKCFRVGVGNDEKQALHDYRKNKNFERRKSPRPRPEPHIFDGRPLMSLEAVAEKAFDGVVTVDAVLREVSEGRLHAYRIGKRYFATPDSVEQLINGNGPLRRTEGSAGVYVVGFSTYIKIGISVNVRLRIAGIQTPEKMTTYAVFEGGLREEVMLHRRFAAYRLNGEWFRKEGDLAEWIDGGCK